MDEEKLYELCFMKVYSYVLLLCRDSVLAEEITQETFYRAMRSSEKARYRAEAEEYTWLCAIAKRLLADEGRRRAKWTKMPDEVLSGEDIDADLADKDEAFRIHRALHDLDEPYKEVFQLRVFGELGFFDIAALFGKTESWARVTYHRAKLKIQERLQSEK